MKKYSRKTYSICKLNIKSHLRNAAARARTQLNL